MEWGGLDPQRRPRRRAWPGRSHAPAAHAWVNAAVARPVDGLAACGITDPVLQETLSHPDASGLSPERHARFYIDVARAHAHRRPVGEATAALIKADRLAPEHVRTHQAARECLDDLLAQSGRRPPADLTDLAQRAGLR